MILISGGEHLMPNFCCIISESVQNLLIIFYHVSACVSVYLSVRVCLRICVVYAERSFIIFYIAL